MFCEENAAPKATDVREKHFCPNQHEASLWTHKTLEK